MILTPDGKLAVKDVDGKWTIYDLNDTYKAEGRIGDIARVNPGTAPELLAMFNKAYLDLDKIIKALGRQLVEAKNEARKLRAKILLDKADTVLKERGLKASADLREAIVDLDDGYNVALDLQQGFEAAIEHLSGKQKSIEMAYGSVRKILGGSQYTYKNPNLNSGRGPMEESNG